MRYEFISFGDCYANDIVQVTNVTTGIVIYIGTRVGYVHDVIGVNVSFNEDIGEID